jgi:hypothetical protein
MEGFETHLKEFRDNPAKLLRNVKAALYLFKGNGAVVIEATRMAYIYTTILVIVQILLISASAVSDRLNDALDPLIEQLGSEKSVTFPAEQANAVKGFLDMGK